MNQKQLNGHHVFIIEDDPFMQSVLNHCFSKNYTVSMFGDGMTAMAAMQSGNIPELIITDLNTPFLNGFELIKQVKASGIFNAVPVIILTGDYSSENKSKCLSAGADDYIVKPFNPKELEIRVNIVLKRTGNRYALMHA